MLAFRADTGVNVVNPLSGAYFGFGGGVQSGFGSPIALLDARVGMLPRAGEGARVEARYEAWLAEGNAVHLVLVSIGVHRKLRRPADPATSGR